MIKCDTKVYFTFIVVIILPEDVSENPTETGYYYLNTRYYDPVVGRFLNADGYVNASGGFTGYNMFAYCNNNPIMYVDYNGDIPILIIGAIIGLATNLASTLSTDILYRGEFSSCETYAGAIIGGAVGGMVATVAPHLGAYVRGATSTLATQIIQNGIGVDDRTAEEIAINSTVNGLYSLGSSYVPIKTPYGDAYSMSNKSTLTDLANGSAHGAINGGIKGSLTTVVKEKSSNALTGIVAFVVGAAGGRKKESTKTCAYYLFEFALCDCERIDGKHAGQI